MKISRFQIGIISLTMIVVLIAGMLCACTEEEKTTVAPATTAAPATTEAPAIDTIELIISTPMPPMAPPAANLEAWAAKLAEVSDGKITCTIHYASSLFTTGEALESLKAGIADVCHLMLGDFPTVFQLSNFITLPFLGFSSPEQAGEIYRQLLADIPEMAAEYGGMKLLYPACSSEAGYYIHTTDKQVMALDDIKGMSFLGRLPSQAQWLEMAGATAVNIASEDIYTSTERGILEGMLGGFGGVVGEGVLPLMKYHTNIGTYFDMGFDAMVMNQDTWNGLSPATQELFIDLSDWYYDNRIAVESAGGAAGLAQAQEEGHTIADLPAAEVQKFMDVAKPMHDAWIADVEAAGKPAQELYDRLQELLSQ